MRAFLLVAVLLLAGCAGSPIETPDETTGPVQLPLGSLEAGNLSFERVDWDNLPFVSQGSRGVYPVQYYGEATIPEGDGPFPVVLIMHGRHGTCSYAPGVLGFEFLGQPCPRAPPVMEPVDSYAGYRPLAEHMASHGIASVSVSANDVNDYDLAWGVAGDDSGATARGRIILQMVEDMQAAQSGSQNAFSPFADRLDLENIGLMGHSRGGEGVARATTLAPERFAAVFPLAPTDFARWVVPDQVAFGTILPYCDGDVYNLQGAWMYDDRPNGPKHQFLHMGANHNFYNSVWTGDDWGSGGDPYCGSGSEDSGRLTMDEQMEQGVAIMSTFFRYYLGNETDLWPYLEGTEPFGFDVKVSSEFEVGHSLSELSAPDRHGTDRFHGVSPTVCSGASCPIPETYSRAEQYHLSLQAGESTYVDQRGPLSQYSAMTVRIGLSQDATEEQLQGLVMFAEDDDGARYEWPLADHGLFIPPGDNAAKTTLNMVHLTYEPLVDVIDLSNADKLGFYAYADVEFQFVDWFERAFVPDGPLSQYH